MDVSGTLFGFVCHWLNGVDNIKFVYLLSNVILISILDTVSSDSYVSIEYLNSNQMIKI